VDHCHEEEGRMRLSARRLNRATLARQFLLERRTLPPVDAVRHLVGLQAQEAASPYLALWSRLTDFRPDHLDAAYRSYAVVKATLLRITLHAVDSRDRAGFHRAMTPTLRAAGLYDQRFRDSGLPIARLDDLVPHVLAFAREPRRRQEIEAMMADHLGTAPDPGVWRALRIVAPLVHAPSDEPWAFGRSASFVAAPEGRGLTPAAGELAGAEGDAEPREEAADVTAAIAHLIWRYLAAFGPATKRDFAQFALLRQPDVGPALERLAGRLATHEGPGGATLYDVPDATLPDEDVPAPPRLLPMWDSLLLAYADRGRVIPPAYRPQVTRRNGDVLPTVLVDGSVAGVWRVVCGAVGVTAFEPFADAVWEGIDREARALLGLVGGRDGALYGRYGHWWSKLEGRQTLVVGR
jgi:hypothetical protein